MHKPPICHKLSKLRFLYCCFLWSLLIVMVQFVFRYQQRFQSYELLKVTIIQHVKLRKQHLQVFCILTRPDFQKDAPVQICVRCWKKRDAVIGNPLPCCWSKIVTMKPSIASQHQLSCRLAAPLLWQPNRSMIKVVSFPQNTWTHELEIASMCEGGSSQHLSCNLKISKIPISNSAFRAILQKIILRHMGGLCIYGHIYCFTIPSLFLPL